MTFTDQDAARITGLTVGQIAEQRARWDIGDDMVPVSHVPGAAVCWITRNAAATSELCQQRLAMADYYAGKRLCPPVGP